VLRRGAGTSGRDPGRLEDEDDLDGDDNDACFRLSCRPPLSPLLPFVHQSLRTVQRASPDTRRTISTKVVVFRQWGKKENLILGSSDSVHFHNAVLVDVQSIS